MRMRMNADAGVEGNVNMSCLCSWKQRFLMNAYQALLDELTQQWVGCVCGVRLLNGCACKMASAVSLETSIGRIELKVLEGGPCRCQERKVGGLR